MFLNQLNDPEKDLFLKLCAHAVMADDVFEVDEMESMALICHEMMIPNHMPDTDDPIDTVLNQLNMLASKQQKNIIMLETILLLKKNSYLDETEINFLDNIKKKFGLSDEKYAQLDSLANIYIAIKNELTDAIES